MKEATARIKINKLLESAGWRFFADGNNAANIRLEASVTLKKADLDRLGDDFEKTGTGYVDFLLLDDRDFPFIVLEAKSEDKSPLVGKEQARRYARAQNCRFVILSNGNLHYFWDLKRGNPYIITTFPSPESVSGYQRVTPNPHRLIDERVQADYIVLSQRPNYASAAAWTNAAERPGFIQANNLRFLRDYQLKAVHALQRSVEEGNDRFLFEMATGTGKTLTAAAIVKLFLRTGNASRVLFLVDRLELEEQARKVFTGLLSADFQTVVYKEKRDDWRAAEIVVSTVQSFQFNNKYQGLFSPTDFDLVISDEAHRSISGNARAVFEYFVGYKLGLTATPRDYLKNVDNQGVGTRDPREVERRLLLDTYRTFGCESGEPTFRYSLLDGVNDGVLINPTLVDARSKVTTQLLSDQGFRVTYTDSETGEEQDDSFRRRHFEKRFFSDATNALFCKTFLQNALHDPVGGEIGKSIVFAVSQDHAARLTQVMNEMADRMFPGLYQSDFAVQVTSQIADAQQFTINFANNNLLGASRFLPDYNTSKARVCITVGMMTTGYDCPDILNLGLFRPIFSPTDFVQIKGRGTRRHSFLDQLRDQRLKQEVAQPDKTDFKLFDFFGNYEYFETEYNYKQILKLPLSTGGDDQNGNGTVVSLDAYDYRGEDILSTVREEKIGPKGMKIDRMLFEKFADTVRADETVAQAVEAGQWDRVIDYVNREVLDKPEEYYTLAKLRKAAAVDRRLTLREILEKVFEIIPRFKSKDELLEEEFAKFVADHQPDEDKPEEAKAIPVIKAYFKAYATSEDVRMIIASRRLTQLATNPALSLDDYARVPNKYRRLVPEYIKDYLSLNQFAA